MKHLFKVQSGTNRIISADLVRRTWPRRPRTARKGAGGNILIIGGSETYSGAPILSGLAAFSTGCDLVTLYVPECNYDFTRSSYPDFIVQKYTSTHFTPEAAVFIVSRIKQYDALVIGPGLGKHPETKAGIIYLLQKINATPVVIDADAILPYRQYSMLPKNTVVTPHFGEMKRLSGKSVPRQLSERVSFVNNWASRLHCVMLLKSSTSIIASPDKQSRINTNGNEGLTVGGTGDVLTGVVATLAAQGLKLFAAAQLGSFIVGASADRLYNNRGVGYRASELAEAIGPTVHTLLSSNA